MFSPLFHFDNRAITPNNFQFRLDAAINFFKSCKTKNSIPKLSSSTFMSHIQSQKNQFFLQNFEWIQNKLVRMVKLKLERDKPVLFKVQKILWKKKQWRGKGKDSLIFQKKSVFGETWIKNCWSIKVTKKWTIVRKCQSYGKKKVSLRQKRNSLMANINDIFCLHKSAVLSFESCFVFFFLQKKRVIKNIGDTDDDSFIFLK